MGLCEGADRVVSLIRDQGIDREECLLDVANQVCQAVCHGARRSASKGLAFV